MHTNLPQAARVSGGPCPRAWLFQQRPPFRGVCTDKRADYHGHAHDGLRVETVRTQTGKEGKKDGEKEECAGSALSRELRDPRSEHPGDQEIGFSPLAGGRGRPLLRAGARALLARGGGGGLRSLGGRRLCLLVLLRTDGGTNGEVQAGCKDVRSRGKARPKRRPPPQKESLVPHRSSRPGACGRSCRPEPPPPPPPPPLPPPPPPTRPPQTTS